jgi:hypothetical protein
MSTSLHGSLTRRFQMICIELANNVKQEFVVELDNLRGRGGLRVCILE